MKYVEVNRFDFAVTIEVLEQHVHQYYPSVDDNNPLLKIAGLLTRDMKLIPPGTTKNLRTDADYKPYFL